MNTSKQYDEDYSVQKDPKSKYLCRSLPIHLQSVVTANRVCYLPDQSASELIYFWHVYGIRCIEEALTAVVPILLYI